jgi:hypothetical protein
LADGKISLFPKSGKDFSDLAEYEFFHCFPSDLGTIDLGWDNSDSAQEYTVTFTYSYWQKTK